MAVRRDLTAAAVVEPERWAQQQERQSAVMAALARLHLFLEHLQHTQEVAAAALTTPRHSQQAARVAVAMAVAML